MPIAFSFSFFVKLWSKRREWPLFKLFRIGISPHHIRMLIISDIRKGEKKDEKAVVFRGPYCMRNHEAVAKLLALLQEHERMTISEVARRVNLPVSTAIRKVRDWNKLTTEGKCCQKIFKNLPRGRKAKLNDAHTVFIFEMVRNDPTTTVNDIAAALREKFVGLNVSPKTVCLHMKRKCQVTYKRIIPQYFGRNSPNTVEKRFTIVSSWMQSGIDFMNDCVFIDESGFNRNMHRAYGWSEKNVPCKMSLQTKGPNVTIIGAISSRGRLYCL
jgi:transposase